MRAPDVWESARFQAVFVAWNWFRQNALPQPAHQRVTQAVGLSTILRSATYV
jgi:hypothetical protein